MNIEKDFPNWTEMETEFMETKLERYIWEYLPLQFSSYYDCSHEFNSDEITKFFTENKIKHDIEQIKKVFFVPYKVSTEKEKQSIHFEIHIILEKQINCREYRKTIVEKTWLRYDNLIKVKNNIPDFIKENLTTINIPEYREIKDISEYISVISSYCSNNLVDSFYGHETASNEFLFRGHSDSSWLLLPTIYRNGYADNEKEKLEYYYKRILTLDIGNLSKEQSLLRFQHYGGKTRLLDFTNNAMVALQFAVQNHISKTDACVWFYAVGRNDNIKDDEIKQAIKSAYGNSRKCFKYAKVYTPDILNNRMLAQSSKFLMFGKDKSDFLVQYMNNTDSKSKLIKINIPNNKIKHIKTELEILGFNETNLYPDEKGIIADANDQSSYNFKHIKND